MRVNDRLLRGTLAGILSESACVIINYVSEGVLHFAKTRWVNMLSQLVYGRPIKTTGDWVLAYLLCFLIGGALGFLYARFMLPRPGDGNYYFRAIALGLGFMVFAYALGNISRVPTMAGIDPGTIVTTFISATAWGLIAGHLMQRWDKTYGTP